MLVWVGGGVALVKIDLPWPFKRDACKDACGSCLYEIKISKRTILSKVAADSNESDMTCK